MLNVLSSKYLILAIVPFKYFTGYGHKSATSNHLFNTFLGEKNVSIGLESERQD